MAVPILPPGMAGGNALALWMTQAETRLGALENPQQPVPVYACTKALLPPAASFINCVARATDLNILVASDGTNWIRQDSGAVA